MSDDVRAGSSVLVVLLALTGLLRLVFPGDVPFIADEPLLIAAALDALADGSFVWSGLTGTRGAVYGPAPTWFYQVALLATSDLRWVVVVRTLLVTTATGASLVLLARALPRLVAPLGAFAFLSPYLWFYARDLWDNSFLVPLSALLLASYAAYLADDRARWLLLAIATGTMAVLTHLMVAPLVGAIALHFVATRARRLHRSPRLVSTLVIGLVAAGAISYPYLTELRSGGAAGFLLTPSPRSSLFAIDGFRVLTLAGFDYVIGDWGAAGLGGAMRLVSLLAYPVGAYGVFVCLMEDRSEREGPTREVARVLLLSLVFFVLLANGKRLSEHPHYYSGVWVVFFTFWWLGMSDLWSRRWARGACAVQGLVLAGFLVGVAGWLHENRGTRSLHYGPTLANQMEVASRLEALGAPDAPSSSAHHPRIFPQALSVLRRLEREGREGVVSGRSDRGDSVAVEIVYVDPEGRSGEIAVRVLPGS